MILPSTLDELEPRSLGLNLWREMQNAPVDLYVNRMFPPRYVPPRSETDGGGLDFAEDGPFGSESDGIYGGYTDTWRLYVLVGAKKNYESDELWNRFFYIIETPLLTGASTGISDVPAATPAAVADGIYTVDGRLVSVGTETGALPRGLYIVRENGQARKVLTGR